MLERRPVPMFRRALTVVVAAAAVASAAVVGQAVQAAAAPTGHTYVVTSAQDIGDRHVGDGVCAIDVNGSDGPCTVRAAIQEANADAAADTITFDPVQMGTGVIHVLDRLPSIVQPLTIDATAQLTPRGDQPPIPGIVIDGFSLPPYSCPTNRVVIVNSGLADFGEGFQVEGHFSDPVTTKFDLKGVSVAGFACDQIFLYGANSSTVESSWIGVEPGVTSPYASENAIALVSNDVRIGGNASPGSSIGNVIGNIRNAAIYDYGASKGDVIQNNWIGTSDGVTPIHTPDPAGPPTGAEVGIALMRDVLLVSDPSGNGGAAVAGNNPPMQSLITGNVIGGLAGSAILIQGGSTGPTIRGNHLGVTADDSKVLGLGWDGIQISDPATPAPTVDTSVVGSPLTNGGIDAPNLIQDNVIGGAGHAAVDLTGTSVWKATVQGNAIGTDRSGTASLPNKVGVELTDGISGAVIGASLTDTPSDHCPSVTCNLIEHNRIAGVWVGIETANHAAGQGNTVRGNQMLLNDGLGIDVGMLGPDANDTAWNNYDVNYGQGPNASLNAPVVVTGGVTPDGKRSVSGMLMAGDPTGLTVDLYEVAGTSLSRTNVLRTGSIFDVTLGVWTYPAASAQSSTAYPQPGKYIGTVAASDIDPITHRFRFVYPDDLTVPKTFVAVVTDAKGNTSEASSACVGAGNLPTTGGITDPNFADVDQDGLCDEWEAYGLDTDRNGTIDADLPAQGASPSQKDLFVEVDAVDNSAIPGADPLSVEPQALGLTAVQTAFKNAPVPDSATNLLFPGSINLHLPTSSGGVIVDDAISDPTGAMSTVAINRSVTGATNIDTIRFGDQTQGNCLGYEGTAEDRAQSDCVARRFATMATSRYAVFANKTVSSTSPLTYASGLGRYGGDALAIGIGIFKPEEVQWAGGSNSSTNPCSGVDCYASTQAGTFMHELGHTLGLTHGTIDNVTGKPNHLSVMNYSLQFRDHADHPLDYQRGDVSPLVPTQLNETAGIPLGSMTNYDVQELGKWPIVWSTHGPSGCETQVATNSTGPIDWNGDGVIGGVVAADVNGSSPGCVTPSPGSLAVRSEWDHLDFNFRDGAAADVPAGGVDIEQGTAPATAWATTDSDGDGIPNATDNCPFVANPDQKDTSVPPNGIGDACDTPTADLSLTIRPTTYGAPTPGLRMSLVVTLVNNGPATATGVSVQIQRLDTFANMAGATTSGTFDAAAGRWTVGTVPVGASVTLTLTGDIRTAGSVRAYVFTSAQLDPNSSIGSAGPGTAYIAIGGGPSPRSQWGTPSSLDGTSVNNIPLPPVVGPNFLCFGSDPFADGYDSSQCVPTGVQTTPTTPVMQINTADPVHFGPGHLVTFLVNLSSQNGVIAASAKPIDNAVVKVAVPSNARLVNVEFKDGFGTVGKSSYNPAQALWLLPPQFGGIATMYMTLEPLDNNPILINSKLLFYATGGLGNLSSASAAANMPPADAATSRPANDDPANGQALTLAPGKNWVAADLTHATSDAPAPAPLGAHPANPELPGLSLRARNVVWYTFTAPSGGRMTPTMQFSLADQALHPPFTVAPGHRPAALRYWVNNATIPAFDGFEPLFGGYPTVTVQAGDVVHVAVYATPDSCCNFIDSARAGNVLVNFVPFPPNDNFANATPLAPSGSTAVTAQGSSIETGEPTPAGATGSAWWSFTASQNSALTVSENTAASMQMTAYSGSRVNALSPLTDLGLVPGNLRVPVAAGQTVYVQESTNSTAQPYPLTGTLTWSSDLDKDLDGVPDSIDNCPLIGNPDQRDTNGDGIGDACDPVRTGPDSDGDGWFNGDDNCPAVFNPSQADDNNDGIGDACDPTIAFGLAAIPNDLPDTAIVLHPGAATVSNVGATQANFRSPYNSPPTPGYPAEFGTSSWYTLTVPADTTAAISIDATDFPGVVWRVYQEVRSLNGGPVTDSLVASTPASGTIDLGSGPSPQQRVFLVEVSGAQPWVQGTAPVRIAFGRVGNHAPVAPVIANTVDDQHPYTFSPVAQATDADGDFVSVASVGQPADGSVICTTTDCTYTPVPGVTGTETFTVTVTDGYGGSASVPVTLTVVPTSASVTYLSTGGNELTLSLPQIGFALQNVSLRPLGTSDPSTVGTGYVFPFGVLSFTVTGVPAGGTAQISIDSPVPMSDYVKALNGNWVSVGGSWNPTVPGGSAGTLTFALTDGDVFDSDPNPGVIGDPGAPVQPTVVPPAYGSIEYFVPSQPVSVPLAVAVDLVDVNSVAAYGAPVTLTASGSAMVTAVNATTDVYGVAHFTVTNPIAETVTIQATSGAIDLGSVTVTFGQPPTFPSPSVTISATAGQSITPFTFVADGALAGSYNAFPTPVGLALSPDGVLTGTPTAVGANTFTVYASNNFGVSSVLVTVDVANPGSGGSPTSAVLTPGAAQVAVGGSTSITVTVLDASSQPVQAATVVLTPSSGGASVSGTTDANGTVTLPVSATAAGTVTYSATANGIAVGSTSVTYVSAPVVSGTAGLGEVGVPYAVGFSVSSVLPVSWSATGLPAGLAIDPVSGVVSGEPIASGQFAVTVTATSSLSTGSSSVTFNVRDALTISTLTVPAATSGVSYSAPVGTTGGDGLSTFSATGLPVGFSIDGAGGVITGSPTAAGSFPFTVSVVDGLGGKASASYELTVVPGAPASLAVSAPATAQLVSTPVSISVSVLDAAANKVPGVAVSLSASGAGTQSALTDASGVATFTVTSSTPASVTYAATSGAATGAATVAFATPPTLAGIATVGEVGRPYSLTVAIGGDPAPAATVSGLPSWLAFDAATGTLSGTPTAAGSTALTVQAVNSVGSATLPLTIVVNAAVAISTTALPAVTAGTAYSATVGASGGVGAVTWTATGLPSPLVIDPTTGSISGTPASSSTSSVVVTATDTLGASASATLTLVVNAAPPPTGADLALALTASTLATNQTGQYRYRVTNSGTATAAGPITVTDTLPVGETYRGVSGAGWKCSAIGQKVTCTLGAGLAAGRSASFTVNVRVSVRPGVILVNSANVAWTAPDPTPADNTATVRSTVRRG